MEWASTLKYAHISARKARLVADLVRGNGGGSGSCHASVYSEEGCGHD